MTGQQHTSVMTTLSLLKGSSESETTQGNSVLCKNLCVVLNIDEPFGCKFTLAWLLKLVCCFPCA